MRISDYLQIGEKLKAARKKSGLSQRAMAKELDLTISTYSNYENSYSEPPMEVIENFCDKLNLSVDDLFELKIENYKTCIKTFSDLIAILIDLDKRGLSIKGNTTYTADDNQLTAHLSLDIKNAQLATFIPDWNKVNEEFNSGLMDEEEYDTWLKETLSLFNVPIDDFLYKK